MNAQCTSASLRAHNAASAKRRYSDELLVQLARVCRQAWELIADGTPMYEQV